MIPTGEFTFLSSDGTHQVHVQEWLPDCPIPRGVVQIVHGIAEYMGRYHDFACFLARHGFYVVGEDHLGHGKTAADDRELGYTAAQNGWDRMTEDVFLLRSKVKERYPNLPYVLLGHSMGSFLARTYLIRYPGTVTACVLSGTGENPPALVTLGRLLAKEERVRLGDHGRSKLIQSMCFGAYNGQFKPTRTNNDWICRDEAVVDAYCADPLCQFWPTVTLFGDMMDGLRFNANPKHLARMDKQTPIFFFSGDRDPVGDSGKGVEKVRRAFVKAGCRDVTLRLYPEGRHEMLNETNRAEVYQDVLDWIEHRI